MKSYLRYVLLYLTILFALFSFSNAASANSADGTGEIKKGDVILLGRADDAIGFTAEWIVLDDAHTNTGGEGMFLLSRSLIGSNAESGLLYRAIDEDVVVSFSDRGDAYAIEHPDVLDYQSSDIQQWCEKFLASHFSRSEQNALFRTYSSDRGFVVDGLMGGTVDFDPAEDILNGDRLFPLSVEEATNADYGFTGDKDRIAAFNGKNAMWWLRSPHISTFPLDVGMVFPNGTIMDFPVHGRMFIDFDAVTCARPACNLDVSKVVNIQEVRREKNGAVVWSLTLAESGESAQVQALPPDGTIGHTQSSEGVKYFRVLLVAIPVLGIGVVAVLIVTVVKRVRKSKRKSGCHEREERGCKHLDPKT